MTYLADTADRSGPGPALDLSALDRVDRILLGCAAAAWLGALGAGVAATVALVDLSRGATTSGADSGTPWVLYTVIGISAVVIVAAVPLLLRARRTAGEDSTPDPRPEPDAPPPQTPLRRAEAPTEKFRAPATVEPSRALPGVLGSAAATAPDVDRVWLRCTAALVCAMGVATLLTAVSTYLMAVDTDTVAWVVYGVAGAVTLAMLAIPWHFLRELRALLD
ncbi:putative protein [Mycolicibacterium vanbaalenii]|uniref:Transmembrane protein n=1 Tax=Mycolicibacterium vanbaalenii TaxID=110539 RepID=A0A5S9R7V2_MYCVN|nr:DUF2561 family protein [Mycolicibacterium vanbaalenii]CAA0131372.1 putative protein [Mycolicibacterium vanbaalenii]